MVALPRHVERLSAADVEGYYEAVRRVRVGRVTESGDMYRVTRTNIEMDVDRGMCEQVDAGSNKRTHAEHPSRHCNGTLCALSSSCDAVVEDCIGVMFRGHGLLYQTISKNGNKYLCQ